MRGKMKGREPKGCEHRGATENSASGNKQSRPSQEYLSKRLSCIASNPARYGSGSNGWSAAQLGP